MKIELFPFQHKAVNDLRSRIAAAMSEYRSTAVPQVISLQAPTGAGKTIIMAALIENIYYGSESYMEQPEAIFVWLSDSPALNEQSRQKIDLKADKIRLNQCVPIADESFDIEMLEDGHIYFLNTQKLGAKGNLGQHRDTRQYTIWETLENTAKNKSDRLYFIIDEAHRGMQGQEAGKATSIMQRFIKGSPTHQLSPMPVVIGMSATSARFTGLVGNTTNSTLRTVVITPADVRASGLLKDRIVVTYPDDPEKNNDMAVLAAACSEWKRKCEHWYQYSYEQHYAQVNPVLVVQVQPGTGSALSNTNLDDVVAKIEECTGFTFAENGVVHAFGGTGTIILNGLPIHHIEPEQIAEDKRVRVVLFKESLSTGWDCPRAETMVSFRHAQDATYIAQLLGRMIRTPLQSYILVDDYLNDVRLYLPYFSRDTVKQVVDELQNTEGGEIPTVIDSEAMEDIVYVSWSVHSGRSRHRPEYQVEGQIALTDNIPLHEVTHEPDLESPQTRAESERAPRPQAESLPIYRVPMQPTPAPFSVPEAGEQITLLPEIDREGITKFINRLGLLTYVVRTAKIHSYLKSLLDLAHLLTMEDIYRPANEEVRTHVIAMIRSYANALRANGQYGNLSKKVLEFKLIADVFDVFGRAIQNYGQLPILTTSDADLDRQLRMAEAKLGNYGFCTMYGQKYFHTDNPHEYAIDCILFAANEDNITKLNTYAERKFHELNDDYRRYIVGKSEQCRNEYDRIVANSDRKTKHNFTLPEIISVKKDDGGKKYSNHLFADDEGTAQIKLNGWEAALIDKEAERSDFICWLRNPSGAKWALCIPYEISGEIRATYPDFLIVRRDDRVGYVIDILDPHGAQYKDNLGKAKALAEYAEAEPRVGRVQLIRREKDSTGQDCFKRLEMTKGQIRQRVLAAINTDELDHIFKTESFVE